MPDDPVPGAVSAQPESRARWASRMLLLLTAALVVALPALWVSSQYLGSEVAGSLSYPVRDGWCEAGLSPGLGVHCFGDYAGQVLTARHDFGLPDFDLTKHPYLADATQAYNSLYTPVGQLPHVASALLISAGLGVKATFYLYAALLLIAAAAPAIWLAWLWRRSAFALIPLVLLGVAALPVISVIDRGNSAGFVVPFLLGFALFAGKDPPWLAPGFVVAAALVRPQFILLALALIALAKWRQAMASVAAFAGITVVSFAVTAGGIADGLSAWKSNLSGFRGIGDLTLADNANISLARAVVMLGEWIGQAPGSIGSFGRWLAASAAGYPLGVVIITAVAFVLVALAARNLMPRSVAIMLSLAIAGQASTISPGYYLMFATVIAAMVIGAAITGASPQGAFDAERDSSRGLAVFRWTLIGAVTLSLTPLPWGGGTVVPGMPGSAWVHSWILRHIGLIWLGVIALGLIVVLARALRRGMGTALAPET